MTITKQIYHSTCASVIYSQVLIVTFILLFFPRIKLFLLLFQNIRSLYGQTNLATNLLNRLKQNLYAKLTWRFNVKNNSISLQYVHILLVPCNVNRRTVALPMTMTGGQLNPFPLKNQYLTQFCFNFLFRRTNF